MAVVVSAFLVVIAIKQFRSDARPAKTMVDGCADTFVVTITVFIDGHHYAITCPGFTLCKLAFGISGIIANHDSYRVNHAFPVGRVGIRCIADQRAVAKIAILQFFTVRGDLTFTNILTAETLPVRAIVIDRADFIIIAECNNRWVFTTQHGSANIVGTRIGVVTLQLTQSRHACPTYAGVSKRARISIVTGDVVGSVDAASWLVRIATVVRADFGVVAGLGLTQAFTEDAEVFLGAFIAIVAGRLIKEIKAAKFGMTGVVGAVIPVVAILLISPSKTLTTGAIVSICADIAVIT